MELREQSDVYSFGVVLLELISGQPAYDEKRSPPGLVGRFRQHLRAGKAPVLFADPDAGFREQCVPKWDPERCRIPLCSLSVVWETPAKLDSLHFVPNFSWRFARLSEAFARIAEDCIRLPGDGRPKAHQVAARLDELARVARGEARDLHPPALAFSPAVKRAFSL